MKKTIFISPWFHPRYGGGETHLRDLGEYLATKRKEIISLSINFKHKPLSNSPIKILRFGDSKSLKMRKLAYKEILLFLKKNKNYISVVYFFFITSKDLPIREQFEILKFLQQEKIPIMVRITSSGRINEFFKIESNKRYIHTFKSVNCFVCLNSDIKLELRSIGIKDKKIFCVNNGVDTSLFNPNNDSEKLSKYISHNNKTTFLYYGRLSKKKNIDILLDSWRIFCELNPQGAERSRLIIIGDSNFKTENFKKNEKIKIKIKKLRLKNVICGRSIEHKKIPALLNISDIYINLSDREGMPNSLLESMSSGLVCLALKNVLNKKLLKEDSALLDLDPIKIAQRLNFFHRNLNTKYVLNLRKKNRKIILKDYKCTNIFNKYKIKMEKITK